MLKFPSRSVLAWTALLTLIGTVGFWWAKGAHRGWSQHRVPVAEILKRPQLWIADAAHARHPRTL